MEILILLKKLGERISNKRKVVSMVVGANNW